MATVDTCGAVKTQKNIISIPNWVKLDGSKILTLTNASAWLKI